MTAQSKSLSIAIKEKPERLLFPVLLLLIIGMGSLHAWIAANSHSMNADGISYLDIGDAYLSGDWELAISSVWSPMYSWILGLILFLARPSPSWEFQLVHIVNFVIFLAALVSFYFFWNQLTRYRDTRLRDEDNYINISFPKWAWVTLGYLIFATVSLTLIEIWAVTPDMLMSIFVYLAAGLLIRSRMASNQWSTFLLFGVVLGLGYLAKAIMLPVAILFLIVALFSRGGVKQNMPGVLVSLAVFLAIALPFIGIISITRGRITYGDAGTLTYAKHVNGIPYPHWQGEPEGHGLPVHPSRQILDVPAIYEFSNPIGGTYPISNDPAYWYEGIETNFDLENQINQLISSGNYFLEVFFNQLGGLVFGIALLYTVGRRKIINVSDVITNWGLVLIAIAVFVFYSLVTVSGRYIGVFFALFWADLLANVSLDDTVGWRKLVSGVSSIIVIFVAINLLIFNLTGYINVNTTNDLAISTQTEYRQPSWPGEITEELQQLGLYTGDQVGVIGYAFDSYWARLGRFKIVAEMLDSDAGEFWSGSPDVKADVLSAFESSGAKAIVAEHAPNYADLSDWHQVSDTNYFIYLFES